MPLYTFHLYKAGGIAGAFHFCTLTNDGDTFAEAGRLLEEHLTCDLVEVWDGDRAVLARHRFQPVLRSVVEQAAASPPDTGSGPDARITAGGVASQVDR